MVRVMSQQSIQSKGEMITSCISHDEKWSTMSGRLLGFSRQKSLHLGILLWPIYQVARKAVRFKWNIEQGRTLLQVLAPLQASSPALWAIKPSRPSGIRVFQTMPCGVYEKLQWKNHKCPLAFWVKAMPSAQENYIPFEKLLLIVLCAQLKRKHLTTGHQTAMWPELPLVSSSVRLTSS